MCRAKHWLVSRKGKNNKHIGYHLHLPNSSDPAFMFVQLELDAEALERMDELTKQARDEHAATERERARLQVFIVGVRVRRHDVICYKPRILCGVCGWGRRGARRPCNNIACGLTCFTKATTTGAECRVVRIGKATFRANTFVLLSGVI